MKVTHAKFGQGTIINQDANNVTVDFNGVQKTLIIKFANLTNEDGSAFGVAFVAPAKNKISASKLREKLNVTSGGQTMTRAELNDFAEERNRIAMKTISW